MPTTRNSCSFVGAVFVGLAFAASGNPAHAPNPQAAATGAQVPASDVHRSETQYAIPAVTLTREDGKQVNLAAELNDGRPVVLNFIYTSCTTICPMSSEVFEQFQDELGDARDAVRPRGPKSTRTREESASARSIPPKPAEASSRRRTPSPDKRRCRPQFRRHRD